MTGITTTGTPHLGNYVGAIWFGNDNYEPTRKMTGGTLPAMTWQKVMAFAHQGIELKPIPGVNDKPAAPTGPQIAQLGETRSQALAAPISSMPRRSFEVLTSMGAAFRAVEPAAPSKPAPQAEAPAPARLR